MENIIRKPYEISLWDDDLTFKVDYYDKNSGKLVDTKEYIGSLTNLEEIENTTTEVTQYYKERKICIIGSNTMDTPIRAVQGKLVSNVNGSNTLTFSLYSRYYDQDTEQFYINPFLGMMVNERKVKLRYGELGTEDCKWYDFIIKDVKENSDNKTFQYTCKDLFINELSKSGFSIQLDPELENNMGNITYLAEQILEESDWKLGGENDVISQTKEEPLYKILTASAITAKDMSGKEADIEIGGGKYIYGFYSVISNEEPYFQFLYREDGEYEIDDDRVITNSINYYLENVTYTDGKPDFALSMEISSEYRGDKLVRQAITKFDRTIDKYVNVYKKDEVTYYGYTTTEYITPTTVQNYISNSDGFTSDSGWETGGAIVDEETVYSSLTLQGFPDLRDIPVEDIATTENFSAYLKYKRTLADQVLFNSGFSDHRSAIKGLAKDDAYIMRAKIYEATLNEHGRPSKMTASSKTVTFQIAEYTLDKGVYKVNQNAIYFEGSLTMSGDWATANILSKVSKSYTDLINARIGIFFKTPLNVDIYFENFQLYKKVEYDRLVDGSETEYETVVAEPGGELFSAARTIYIYYLPNENYKSIDDMVPAYEGYVDDPTYIKQYNDNQFEKVRSITASESNRFNMIQDLCETFECWAKFEIEHDMQTGEILLDENYRQKKWITFHEYIGKDNYAGFRYGINLKSIQRTLNSDGIVSKIIVKNNANEFAPNGFCSIARAPENPTGENFIYNFDYYIQQGLIEFSEINNDFYLDVNGYLGYYKKLKRLNQDREAKIEEQSKLKTDIAQYEANYQNYKISVESAQEELRDTEQYIISLTGYSYLELKELAAKKESGETLNEEEQEGYNWWDNNKLLAQINKVAQLKGVIKKHSALRDEYGEEDSDGNLNGGKLYEAQSDYDEITEYIKNLANQKRSLNLQFYKKYSRFIQEGSWISEDYVDENLYYLDAESTLYTSAQPKVTYTINVLELSQIQGYENYSFNLGDKTFIEDTEFFGWVWIDGIQTPYHEEIVVSELTIELDSPEKNTVKVQNFKTQFEDLFQRITATTQSVEYHTGEYGRATSIVESDGTISVSTLANSLANNAIRLENSKDQSVVWDETGITTTNLSRPNEIVRIVSGGIFLTTDGGATWNTGITAEGMNANFLTAGNISTSNVSIMNGSFPSFRWDEKGLSAFEFKLDINGNPYGFNTAKFVRYDQYGLYGINGQPNFDPNIKENEKIGEEKIWANANFALTWKGFMLKNKYQEGYVSISSENDFEIYDGTKTRIQIGNISTRDDRNSNPIYGIRISNAQGAPVMETDDTGELWLKNKLSIETYNKQVAIGKLDTQETKDGIHGSRIIDANNSFVVYEDGYMKATGGEFTGTINATGGKIGNITIADVEGAVTNMDSIAEATRKLDISSKLGYNFKVEGGVSSPVALELVATPTAFTVNTSGISWFGSNNFEDWVELDNNTNTYSLTYEDFKEKQLNSTYYVKAVATSTDGNSYEDWTTIMSISDGVKGEDALSLVITSSGGNYFRNNTGQTTLMARLFQGGQEIDQYEPYIYTYTWVDANDDSWTPRLGKTLVVTADDVTFSRTYVCNISKGGK